MTDELPTPKPDHLGIEGPPFGPMVYLIVSHDGKMLGVEPTRHDASWTIKTFHDCNDYEVRYVPVGSVPIKDLSIPGGAA